MISLHLSLRSLLALVSSSIPLCSQLICSFCPGSSTVPTPFLVRGFSVTGQIVDLGDDGLEGARILVNTKFTTTSEKDGSGRQRARALIFPFFSNVHAFGSFFVLDALQSGTYQITAELPHYSFESRRVTVSPTSASIGKIAASASAVLSLLTTYLVGLSSLRVELCGLVNIPSSGPVNRVIQIRADNGKQSIFRYLPYLHSMIGLSHRMDVKSSGSRFCTSLPAGTYLVSPQLLPQEVATGVILFPTSRSVTLSKGPVEIAFEQVSSIENDAEQVLSPV